MAREPVPHRPLHELELEARPRYNEPPNNAHPFHPELGDSYFWRYYKATDEGCPCEHGACCMALFCPHVLHGEVTQFATGQNKCGEWMLCWPLFGTCMIENERNLIEKKINSFHRERGDPRAKQHPVEAGKGVACFGVCCGPGAAATMHAQNYWVMKEFQRVQAEHL